MGVIYLVTNKINGKQYVGKTIRDLNERKSRHINDAKAKRTNFHFHRAIHKYGEENFEWEIIDECDNENLNELEIFYIQKYNTLKNGYNMTEGGDGFASGENNPMKRPELRAKISGDNNPMKRLENRNKFVGDKNPMRRPEVVAKLAAKIRGTKQTKEHMKNNSKAHRGKGLFGFTGGHYAIKHIKPWNKVWKAEIRNNGKTKFLGYFHDPLSCQIVYDLVWNEIYNI